jgi:hypothetical protein
VLLLLVAPACPAEELLLELDPPAWLEPPDELERLVPPELAVLPPELVPLVLLCPAWLPPLVLPPVE